MPITSTIVDISDHCIGNRWEVTDETQLAELVGIVAKCEFGHAQSILSSTFSAETVYTVEQQEEIKQDIISALTLKLDTKGKEVRSTEKWHRDGFLFEAISWIVARKDSSSNVLMRDPHIGATTPGLDGLMIELNTTNDDVIKTTVMEDKCVENRTKWTFKNKTLPAMVDYHTKSRKVLESATTLLRQQFPAGTVNSIAAKAIKLDIRNYRASLTIVSKEDNQLSRAEIFESYEQLDKILQENRVGCTFLATDDVREWFEQFAKKVIASL